MIETIIEPGRLTGGSQGTPTLSAFHLKPSRKLSRPWPKKPLRKLSYEQKNAEGGTDTKLMWVRNRPIPLNSRLKSGNLRVA
jgi:hypothetical protein